MRNYVRLTLLSLLVGIVLLGCQKKTPDEKLAEARELYNRPGQQYSAIHKLKQLIKESPETDASMTARLELAQFRAMRGEQDLALTLVQEVLDNRKITTKPGFDALRMKIGLKVDQKQFEEAIEELKKTLESLSSEQDAYANLEMMLAEVYLRMEDYPSAEMIYKKNIEEERNPIIFMASLEFLVQIYDTNEQYDKAIGVYQAFIDKHPEDQRNLSFQVGIAYYTDKKGETDKAGELYEKMFAQYQTLIDETLEQEEKTRYIFELARAYELKKDYETAIATYQSIANDFSDSNLTPYALMGIGNVMITGQKNYDKAFAWFQDIEKKYPNTQLAVEAQRQMYAIRQLQVEESTQKQSGATSPTMTTSESIEEQPGT